MADIKDKLKKRADEKSSDKVPVEIDEQAIARQQMRMALDANEQEIKKALPSNMDVDRFKRIALTAYNSNPDLAKCSRLSFISAVVQSAQLGLEPNTPLGHAYLIPFWDKHTKSYKVQFTVGYKGMIELANRSDKYTAIYAHPVYTSDVFEIEYGLHKKLKHIPNFDAKNRGEIKGYYAVYKLINGGYNFEYMTKYSIMEHAKRYATNKYGQLKQIWTDQFEAMAKKTVLKEVLKYAPKSVELQQATAIDELIINDEEDGDDNIYEEIDWQYIDPIPTVDR